MQGKVLSVHKYIHVSMYTTTFAKLFTASVVCLYYAWYECIVQINVIKFHFLISIGSELEDMTL